MKTQAVSAALATVLALAVLSVALGRSAAGQDEGGGKAAPSTDWPAPVKDLVPVQPGEHPRLLFRKADLPALRKQAETPEGKAILVRLRKCLNGGDGETMPPVFGTQGPVSKDGSGPHAADKEGTFTISHATGYGFLYQLTGDKKYAELGKQCFEKALEGYRDRDQRYSFLKPYGALRAGPSIGWMAVGYDLCYDGWDPAFQKKIAGVFCNYNEGQWLSLEELSRGKRQHPGSNHWGMEVGGAAMALLAIMDDPGANMAKLKPLLEASQECMIRNMTQGFGDGGFFAEGDGTGSMSSHIIFLEALQAWRNAAGKDFISPRPNAQWMALKWFFLTVPTGDRTHLRQDFPERGAYPHNIWSRGDKSGGGYFSIGFGVASPEQKAGILWFYNHNLKEFDEKKGTPFDTPSVYPHHSVLSFVNWPWGMQERNPGEVIPHAYRDTKWGFYAWRGRWQDQDDVVISILTRASHGNMGAAGESTLTVWGCGKKQKWGTIKGFTGDYQPAKDGSTILTTGDGSCLAIDFSRASGADAMLVMTGPGAPAQGAVAAGGANFSFLFLTKGAAPTPKVEGNDIIVGNQKVSFDGKKIVLGK